MTTREEKLWQRITSIIAACAKLQEGVDTKFLEELIDIDEKLWIIVGEEEE